MFTENVPLAGAAPGAAFTLSLLHFGEPGALPKAYIQGGLHADEGPGMLCAHHLRAMLAELEALGLVRGHIALAPAANPLGLSQVLFGHHEGRFQLADGVNFNRDFPVLADEALALLDDRFGSAASIAESPDIGATVVEEAVTDALRQALSRRRPGRLADHLKHVLLCNALGASTVLDLHCDGEALNHLYCPPAQAEAFMPLARWLGAVAVLTAEVSGGQPFDEAISRPWAEIASRLPEAGPVEAPIAGTVELRGHQDMDHALAKADARAIVNLLALRGHLAIEPDPLPEAACAPTPLAACENIEAPASGLVVFRQALGAMLAEGDPVADIVEPISGAVTTVRAQTAGVFFARSPTRVTQPGRRLGKIAGANPFRTGYLLSP
jgi:hypothetical protein